MTDSQKNINDFALRLAKTILDLGSSHVYFIMQQAYAGNGPGEYGKFGEEMDYSNVQSICSTIIASINPETKACL